METHTYKLLVEGGSDQHVVWNLCKHHAINENFDVIDCGSVENVLKQLRIRLTTPLDNRRIGVVVDADEDIQRRWDQIKTILSKDQRYSVPDIPSVGGTIIESNDNDYPLIGIWIMPDNSTEGMLEDFVVSLSEEDDPLMKEVDSVLAEIERKQLNKYAQHHHAKAKIHTFLAWQKNPGCPMGTAITAKILNPEAESAFCFLEWIRQLYI